MARLGTSWNRIQVGDIITFNYKSKGTAEVFLKKTLNKNFLKKVNLFLDAPQVPKKMF